MLRLLRTVIVVTAICLAGLPANSQVPTATTELALGVSFRDKGDYPGAIEHLQRAVALDPKSVKAHFLLASVADQTCLPNAEPGRDAHACNLALQEYENVLRLDSSHLEALKNSAYLLFQLARFDESERRYRVALTLQPDDGETLCAIGAIDFHRSSRDLAERRAKLHLRTSKPLIHSPECQQARIENEPRIEEGIALLQKSYHVESRNPEISGYLGPLYVLRAEIQCGNPQLYKADRNTAEEWNKRNEALSENGQTFYRKCPPAPPPSLR